MSPEPLRLQTCVECGSQVERLIGGLCPTCFVAKEPLLDVPTVLDVELCAHCDARHVGAHWFDPEEADDLAEIREGAVRGVIKVHPRVADAHVETEERAQDERTFRATVTLAGNVDGAPVAGTASVLVRLRRAVCDRCSRMFGGYYAAVLQLRASERDVTKAETARVHKLIGAELDRMRATGNRDAFLTKSGPVPGGFDYYLGDIDAGRIIGRVVAARLGATVVETAKLVGRKEGEDIYRVTFLVRINLFANGDFARLGDEERLVQVLQLDRGRAMVLDLATHKRDKVDADRLRRLGGPELVQDAVLVSQDAGNIQVLDPVSLATVDLPRPEGFAVEGDTVPVFRHEERLFLPALSAPAPPASNKP
ncbi:MAG: 60S ribosomal export protein NMD3 [Thermoplasmatota archaeon]|nr:60S ribosomal export protein NMD3 [Halobacteriales archaeon]